MKSRYAIIILGLLFLFIYICIFFCGVSFWWRHLWHSSEGWNQDRVLCFYYYFLLMMVVFFLRLWNLPSLTGAEKNQFFSLFFSQFNFFLGSCFHFMLLLLWSLPPSTRHVIISVFYFAECQKLNAINGEFYRDFFNFYLFIFPLKKKGWKTYIQYWDLRKPQFQL